MRSSAFMLLSLFLAACSGSLEHESPYDTESPLEKQARASLRAVVLLEGETDHAQVGLQLQNTERTYTVETSTDGSAELTGIVPGTYTLRISSRYFAETEESVTLTLGEQLDLGERALRLHTGLVVGNALQERIEGGRLVSGGGVSVTLLRTGSIRSAASAPALRRAAQTPAPQPATAFTTVSSSGGRYQLAGVPAGTYSVTASASGMPNLALGEIKVTGEEAEVAGGDALLHSLSGFFDVVGTVNGQPSSIYTQVAGVTLKLSGFNAEKMALGETNDGTAAGCVFSPSQAVADTAVVTLSGQGVHTLCAKFIDADGRASDISLGRIMYDATPPSPVNVAILTSNGYSKTRDVALQLTAADTLSGVASLVTAPTAVSLASALAAPFQPLAQLVFASDGAKTVWVSVADAAGNRSAPQAVTVTIDTVDPVVTSATLTDGNGSPIAPGANITAARVNVASTVADASPLQIQVTTNGSFAGAEWQTYAASKGVDLPASATPSGADVTVMAQVRDAAGNVSPLLTRTVHLDTVAPTGTLTLASATPTNNSTLSLLLSASESPSEAQVSEDPSFASAVWFATVNTSVTLPNGDGTRVLYARFRDAAGNLSSVKSVSVVLDKSAPQGASAVISGGSVGNQTTVTFDITTGDAAQVNVSDAGCLAGTWQNVAPSLGIPLTDTNDGPKTFHVSFRDALGNATACVTRGYTLDRTPPTVGTPAVSFVATGGYVSSPLATVTIDVAGATQMMLANDAAFSGAAWSPVTTSTLWPLAGGDGSRTLYAKFRDDAGNIVGPYTATVTLDRTPPALLANPVVLAGCCAYSQGQYTVSRDLQISLNATGWTKVDLYDDLGLTSSLGQLTAAASFPAAIQLAVANGFDGDKSVYAVFSDEAGNKTLAQASIILDGTAPSFPQITMAAGSTISTSPVFNVTIQGVETGTGIASVDLSESATFASGVVNAAYNPTLTYTLVNTAAGPHTVYMRLRDRAGNVSTTASLPMLLDGADPAVASVSINTNASLTNNTLVALTVSAGDDNGIVDMQISEDAAFAGAAWVAYTTQPLFTLSALQGTKTVYVRVRDRAGRVSNVLSDTISLDTLPPSDLAMAVNGGAPLTNSFSAALELTAVDANLVQVRITGDINAVDGFAARVGAWIAFAPAMTLQLIPGDGTHAVQVEFRDTAGNTGPAPYGQTVNVDTVIPAAPVLTLAVGGHHRFTATWQPVSDATAYQVVYAFAQGTDTPVATEGASPVRVNGTTATLHGLANLRNYRVEVRAVDAAGNLSPVSNAKEVGLGLARHNIGRGSGPLAVVDAGRRHVAAVVRGAYLDLYVSGDGGLSWALVDSHNVGTIEQIAAAGTREGAAYVVVNQRWWGPAILFMTHDAGLTWRQSVIPQPAGQTNQFFYSLKAVGDRQVFMCGYSGAFFYSNDGGRSIAAMTTPLPTNSCDIAAKHDSVTIASGGYWGGLVLATSRTPADGFSTWTITNLYSNPAPGRPSLMISPVDPRKLYLTFAGNDGLFRLFESADDAATWTQTALGDFQAYFVPESPNTAIDDKGTFYMEQDERLLVGSASGWLRLDVGLGNLRPAAPLAFAGLAPMVPIYDPLSEMAAVISPIVPPPSLFTFFDFRDALLSSISFAWPLNPAAETYEVELAQTRYGTGQTLNLATINSGTELVPPGATRWVTARAYDADGPSEYAAAVSRTTFGPWVSVPELTDLGGALIYSDGEDTAYLARPTYGAMPYGAWTTDAGLSWTVSKSIVQTVSNFRLSATHWLYACYYGTAKRSGTGLAEMVTMKTNGFGCGVAADGHGRVAFAFSDFIPTTLHVWQSTDSGETFSEITLSCPTAFGSVNWLAPLIEYDVWGSLYVFNLIPGTSNTAWCMIPNGVRGRGNAQTFGTLENVVIDSDSAASYADGDGYIHVLAQGPVYLRNEYPGQFTAVVRHDLGSAGTVGSIFPGATGDLYLSYRQSSAAYAFAHSTNNGASFTASNLTPTMYSAYDAIGQLGGELVHLQGYWAKLRRGATFPRYDGWGRVAGTQGLAAQVFATEQFVQPVDTVYGNPISIAWAGAPTGAAGAPADNFSVRWTGSLMVDTAENYTFYVTAEDGVRLWIDGTLLIDSWSEQASTEHSGAASLTPGWHKIRLDYVNGTGPAAISIEYAASSMSRRTIPRSKLTKFIAENWNDMRAGAPYVRASGGMGYDVSADPPNGTALSFAPDNDDGTTAVALPFTFRFYGTPFNTVNVSTNGFLDFDDANVSAAVPAFPVASALWDDTAAVFAGDLQASSAIDAGVYTYVLGTAPWRTFIVTWYNWARKGQTGDRLKFQALLHETSNEITYRYSDLSGSPVATYLQAGVNRGNSFEGQLWTIPYAPWDAHLTPNPDQRCTAPGAVRCY